MGQFHDSPMDTRVAFDENSENGLIFGGIYLPEELLSEILCYVDLESLLKCQLVCKRWKMLLRSYVWRKKAEIMIHGSLPPDPKISWQMYYLICKKRPFERNLMKNHSGEYGVKKHWTILHEGGHRWRVENPPVGVPPLPVDNEAVFQGRQFCFVTSFQKCTKTQMIDLQAEGLHPYFLDKFRPTIAVSEWYSCRWDCPAVYKCSVQLLTEDNLIMDSFEFRDNIEGDRQNEWLRVSHEFKNYGPGLRKISFFHEGRDKSFWAGHYGSKMAGASVCVKIPTSRYPDAGDTSSNTE